MKANRANERAGGSLKRTVSTETSAAINGYAERWRAEASPAAPFVRRTQGSKSAASVNATGNVQFVQSRLNVTEIDPKRHQFDSVASEKRRKRPREWHCFVPPGRRAWAKEDFQKIIFRARIDSPSPLRRSNLNPNPFSPTSVRSGFPRET
jgi:hypothetical protein